MNVKNSLIELLEKKNTNQSQLALACDTSSAVITLIIKGDADGKQLEPKVGLAILIARALDISVEDVFTIERSEISGGVIP